METQEFLDILRGLRQQARQDIAGAMDSAALEAARVRYLGKKSPLSQLLRTVGTLPPDQRPRLGQEVNAVRQELEEELNRTARRLADAELAHRLQAEAVDVTLPGRRRRRGTRHPLTRVLEEIQDIFVSLGYWVAEGPEVELDYYNFEALNLPKGHPAREMHDSLYITEEILLRTHTSPVQVRTMKAMAPEVPVRIIAPGRVYRRDALDATHSPVFHQVEGLEVDRGTTFADLKGTLAFFAKRMFGQERQVRFRPSYFPFTEPSAEMDVSCLFCNGAGCRVCKGSGWIEILGCGSVHPFVLQESGYDPEEVSGFAFGMGLERIAMLKYGIDDIRLFLQDDLNFLRQFARG